MDFSARIKEICKAKGIMMKELAERLSITPTGLSKAIGQDYPQLQTLERIAAALGVEVVDLFAVRGDFIAFVRQNGETRTFTAFDELRDYVNREQ